MSTQQKGLLYLLPSAIGTLPIAEQLPANYAQLINKLDYFIVEDERTARRFLRSAGFEKNFNDCTFLILNEHTQPEEIKHYLDPSLQGHDMGLLSDAGCPCVADPGALVVAMAHQQSVSVIPLVGPSSIILSLMGSGLNGQSFRFIGYLPLDKHEKTLKLKEIERNARSFQETQIFIEAPYRNKKLFDELVQVLPSDLKLCVAVNLQSENQVVLTKTIAHWKKTSIELNKVPTVFLINS